MISLLKMRIISGRTLVFGSHTGISFDGHVLLNSGEVRHNWLDVSSSFTIGHFVYICLVLNIFGAVLSLVVA